MNPKPNMITLGVKDFNKSVEFYEKGLGWKKSNASIGDLALFNFNGIILGLYPRKLLAEDATIKPRGRGFPGITISILAENEKEVDSFMQKAQKAGAKIIKPPQKVFWGGYSGYFRDLDGHLWEVAYNPNWKQDKNGNPEI